MAHERVTAAAPRMLLLQNALLLMFAFPNLIAGIFVLLENRTEEICEELFIFISCQGFESK